MPESVLVTRRTASRSLMTSCIRSSVNLVSPSRGRQGVLLKPASSLF